LFFYSNYIFDQFVYTPMLSVQESLKRMRQTTAANEAYLREIQRAMGPAKAATFAASLLPETNERVAGQMRLEKDIMDMLSSSSGASFDELATSINAWIDQGRDIDVEYAVVLLKLTGVSLLTKPPKYIAVCAGCQHKVAWKRCAACSTSYCSRDCQLAHWPVHRNSDCHRKNKK
jgi:hypothetical protein